MNIAIILVVAAALALGIILRAAVTRRLTVSPQANLAAQIQPIDLEAFRNLASPAEDDYLRRRLPPAAFRAVRRERLRAVAAYVHAAARNAEILVRIGQGALLSSDARTVEAARQLVDQALLLRRNATFVLLRIYLALAWPYSGLGTTPILEDYVQLSGSAMLLGRLQSPGSPVRISAS
ncbi:MAG TPA: hypothetical protein VEJ00_04310 [Candidatus Acidoferrales bacterium]|nr:hypothetical protein [Candidatus Acidoferrales bacterium]